MRQATIFLLLLIFLVSCIDDFQKDLDMIGEPEWSPTIGIPLVHGTFTMEDYIDATSEEISISQSTDGVIIIEYGGNPVASDYAEDLIEVPTQNFTERVSIPGGGPGSPPITGEISVSESYDKDIEPEPGSTDVIDSVFLKAGTLIIEIEPNVPADGQLDLTINTLIKDGAPINYSTSWTYNPANPGMQTIRETIDLTDVFADFTKGGTATNNFAFDVDATLTFDGESISLFHNIRVNVQIENPLFRLVYGKFSEREFETELETVGLGIFDSVNIEGFYLDQPSIEFNFQSSYGVPVEASIITLDAVNSDGDVLPFSGTAISEPTVVSGPGLDEVGTSVETTLVIDKSNSNITDVISFLPAELDYEFAGKVISTDPTASQFVLDTSRVVGEYKVVLPLDGRVTRFESDRTIRMDSDSTEESQNFGETVITLKSLNGLPISVGMEVQFLDEFDNEIITLFKDDKILEPGEIDSNGFVINPTENRAEQTLTGEEASKILNAKAAIIKTILNTGETGTEIVKFRMTDEVSVSLFLQTTITF